MKTALAALCAGLALAHGHTAHSPAAAPGPGKAAQKADVLFTLPASSAHFDTPAKLRLSGVADSVAYSSDTERVGITPTDLFAQQQGPYQAQGGAWLASPEAALIGHAPDGNLTVAILTLSKPVFANGELTFEVMSSAKVPLSLGGVVETAADDASKGIGPKLLAAPLAGEALTGAVLFINSNRNALGKAASIKGWSYHGRFSYGNRDNYWNRHYNHGRNGGWGNSYYGRNEWDRRYHSGRYDYNRNYYGNNYYGGGGNRWGGGGNQNAIIQNSG